MAQQVNQNRNYFLFTVYYAAVKIVFISLMESSIPHTNNSNLNKSITPTWNYWAVFRFPSCYGLLDAINSSNKHSFALGSERSQYVELLYTSVCMLWNPFRRTGWYAVCSMEYIVAMGISVSVAIVATVFVQTPIFTNRKTHCIELESSVALSTTLPS